MRGNSGSAPVPRQAPATQDRLSAQGLPSQSLSRQSTKLSQSPSLPSEHSASGVSEALQLGPLLIAPPVELPLIEPEAPPVPIAPPVETRPPVAIAPPLEARPPVEARPPEAPPVPEEPPAGPGSVDSPPEL